MKRNRRSVFDGVVGLCAIAAVACAACAEDVPGSNPEQPAPTLSANVETPTVSAEPTDPVLDPPARPVLVEQVRTLATDHGVTPIPPAPQVRDELFVLGQALMFDKVLSGDRNIACMTCHHPTVGTDDDRHLPLGTGGEGLAANRLGGPIVERNAPPLFNLHAVDVMFWDGRLAELPDGTLITPAGAEITPEMIEVFEFGAPSAMAMFPVSSHTEMRGELGTNELADAPTLTDLWQRLMVRLGEHPGYVAMFEAAYPGTPFEEMTFAHAGNAMAGYEIRAFESRNSPWQQFLRGDDDALTDEQLLGARAFFTDGCVNCHTGPMLTDQTFHNTGLVQFGPGKGHGASGRDDYGRAAITGHPDDLYAFRTATLHNIELTAPYGHDGQYPELDSFVRHYLDPVDELVNYDMHTHVVEHDLHDLFYDNTDEVMAGIDPLTTIETDDIDPLLAFLQALTDEGALDLRWTVPSSVPSGLPLED